MYEHKELANLFIVSHPLIQHKLTHMREKSTGKRDFRAALKEIALLMGYEITRNLPLTTRTIETPIQTMEAPVLKDAPPVIVPILRAALGMADGLEEIMPDAQVGHIGLYRDHETHLPVEYLIRLPKHTNQSYILVDPMLATGNSAKHAVDVLLRQGIPLEKISFMALVAAPEGVKVLHDAYPEVPVYVASLDEKLNENAYIVPGLGDAGDRLFGTL
ncbi:MAG: uracil phosphoribosyltransferase [Alphaproteobacteria bacterium]|nr:uracil phosphoribosyltransferase [Alphaproteobacteria bacterium]MCD8562617.1 uracil phosphoribosyltransferase [Alphaproteobacteria bacterium]